MEEYKVSIIVAIYNSELYLPVLFKSLKNQTYKNLEIILVDDGSPDGSGALCDSFALQDSRVVVIHKNNGGTCEARNEGLDAATGQWVMIVDGDDWLEPDCVEYLLNLALTSKSDMAYSTNIFTTRDRKQIKSDSVEVWASDKAAAYIFYPMMALGPWNKIYSKALIDKYNIRFDVPWFGEGLYFSTTCAQYANHVSVGKRKVYNYRLNNEGSGLSNYSVINGRNALNNIKTIYNSLILDTSVIKNAAAWHLWHTHMFLLIQIIGTESEIEPECADAYRECIRKIRSGCIRTMLRSEVGLVGKIKILATGVAPATCARLAIYRNKKRKLIDRGRFMDPFDI